VREQPNLIAETVIGSVRFIEEFNVKKLKGRRRGIRICSLKGIVRYSEMFVKGRLTVDDMKSFRFQLKSDQLSNKLGCNNMVGNIKHQSC
jgi:hypothetical protein